MFRPIKKLRDKWAARRDAKRADDPPPPTPGPIIPSPVPSRRLGLFQRILMNWLKRLFAFASVNDTVKGLVNQEELFKSIAASLTSGGVISAVLSVLIPMLTMLSDNAAMIFPNPVVAGLAGALLTLIIQLLGRSVHGETPTLLAPGSQVPSGGAITPAPADPAALVSASGPRHGSGEWSDPSNR